MFENLSQKLDKALKMLKGQGSITEINVAATIKEIRRALLDADVNFKVAKEITDEIKEQAIGSKILIAVSPREMFIKIVYDKLTELMGGQKQDINIKGDPAVVMIAGLNGAGKTTFSGKLANFLKSQGRQVLLAACDVYRPAAMEQLKVLGGQIGVEVYTEMESKDAVQIAQNAIQYAKANNKKIVIVDTAGRLAIDEVLMKEIAALKKALNPTETLFVVDAMTGQDAVNTALAFNERIDYDGVVLTKLDGDARGGAALSIRKTVNKPIKFISTGEKMEAIDHFYPDRMAQRILGMGDVLSLVERAQRAFDEEEAKRIEAKIRKNQLDFNDFLSQIQQIKRMGNLKDLVSMIPGMGKALKEIDIDDDSFKPIEAMIFSMTKQERAKPEIINSSRKQRIAKGSGTTVQQVNNLLKQFEQMRQLMKKMNQINPAQLQKMKAKRK
ncbi:MAG: signal recognition particle protein [Thermoflexibacter sp.]|uniref:Signal recognition particle protein n=1 Tax=Thermoflexibacter ruber TaxID=1003 RepID=A0A1I2C861_9BACT|nr:signal recognition particle protein [Thermoflexibacter ruber]SFE63870.1 signal recognition particle subunit FFH/SRP54 (srp54) [Thermoflexibacter ruber]